MEGARWREGGEESDADNQLARTELRQHLPLGRPCTPARMKGE